MERLADWLRAVADGETERQPPAGHMRALALLEEAALGTRAGSPETSAAADLMARAHLHGAAAATDLLVRLGHWSEHENLEIHRGRVPIDFSPQVLAEAEPAGGPRWLPAAKRCRRSWRRPMAWFPAAGVAATGSGCDRAFCASKTFGGGIKFTLFMAAPTLLFERDTPIDQEAAVRGRSIATPDRHIPMLPGSVVKAARLVDYESRPALSITVQLSKNLVMKSVKVKLRRVRPRIIAADKEDRPQVEMLKAVAQSFRRARLGRACVPPQVTTLPALIVTSGQPRFETQGDWQSTVDDELTHMACMAVASWCRREDIPAIYQTQSRFESDVGEDVEPSKTLPDRIRFELLRRLMPRPSMQTDPAPEHALGFEQYARIAEPCSRFEDLMMQRQLIASITRSFSKSFSRQDPAYSKTELDQGLAETASARDAAMRVERSGYRYWSLLALEAFDGAELAGTVVERAGVGYRIVLDESGFSAYVPAPGELWAQSGDRIVVRVAQVCARRNQLVLADPRRPSEG